MSVVRTPRYETLQGLSRPFRPPASIYEEDLYMIFELILEPMDRRRVQSLVVVLGPF